MTNGDRITCEIHSLVQGQLTVKQDYANSTMVFDWNKVDNIQTNQPFVVVNNKGDAFSAASAIRVQRRPRHPLRDSETVPVGLPGRETANHSVIARSYCFLRTAPGWKAELESFVRMPAVSLSRIRFQPTEVCLTGRPGSRSLWTEIASSCWDWLNSASVVLPGPPRSKDPPESSCRCHICSSCHLNPSYRRCHRHRRRRCYYWHP